MKCQACGIPPGADCLGERFSRLCVLVEREEPGIAARLRELAGVAPLPRPSPLAPRPSKGPIRACILGPCLYVGGAEVWELTLLRHCDPARVQWMGVGATGDHSLSPLMQAEMEPLAPVALGPETCRRLAAASEVVVSWGLPDIGTYLPAGPDRPFLVATSHGDATSDWTKNVMNGSCPHADTIVAVSEAARGPIPAAYQAQTRIIYNGTDRKRLVPRIGRAAQRAAWGVPEKALVLGYLGRLSAEKGPTALASAIACLPEPWVAVAVGDGLDARNVIDHARKTAPDRVRFPGVTKDIASALAAFDVILIPSFQDGFSMTMVESWSMGIPVICTPVGGWYQHPDLVRMVPIGASGDAIAAAVLADQADDAGTRERTRRARKVARERYGAERFACEWMDLIERVAGRTAIAQR